MMPSHDSLLLHGECWDKPRLLREAREQLARNSAGEWQRAFWVFVQEWLDEGTEVTVHTSGSTGMPKPIRIRKEQMRASALATGAYFGLQKGHRALLCLSCDYVAGKMMVVRAFALGLDLVLASPARPWEGWDGEVRFAAMVPAQVAKMLHETPATLSCIEQLIIGGAAIPREVRTQIRHWPNRCYATYGMTETVTHIAIQALNGPDASDEYQALPGVSLSQDGRGCLVIRAPRVADALVVTNDVVDLCGKNAFRWLGRWDHVINSGGVKLQPERIEAKLSALLKGRFFVAGRPDAKWGEAAVLVWECPPKTKKELEDIRAEMASVLTQYEMPKELICVPVFLETLSGKVRRKPTVEHYGGWDELVA